MFVRKKKKNNNNNNNTVLNIHMNAEENFCLMSSLVLPFFAFLENDDDDDDDDDDDISEMGKQKISFSTKLNVDS